MSTTSQHLIWRLETIAFDGLRLFLRLFPFAMVSAFGGWLLRIIGPLTSKHHIAKTGIKIAFPDISEAELKTLLKAQWDNTGRTFSEFPLTHRLKPFSPKSRVEVIGIDHLKNNSPAVIVTGHFANWEVMATVLSQSGLPVRITYRKLNNPYMDIRIRQQRQKYGTKFLIPKSTHKGGRELFTALKSGESVALLADQKFNEGLSLPFFGVNAMTAPGAVRLALKTGQPLLPLSVTRNKSRFRVTFHAPIELENTGQRDMDVKAGVTQVLQFTETYIRAHPSQWFWVHRRWPKDHYRKS